MPKLESFTTRKLYDFIACKPNSRLVFHIFKQVTQSKLIFGTLLYCPLKKSVLVFIIFLVLSTKNSCRPIISIS